MRNILFTCAFLAASILAGLTGCSDSTAPNAQDFGTLRLYLVDAPGDYQAVNIVVTGVEAHFAGADSLSGWYTVAADTDTIDLLQYVDGNIFALADSTLPVGHYTQFRLLLGEGSNVVVDGETFPLFVPSGMQTGVKIGHDFTLGPDGVFEATLDFDATQSVHRTGKGQYMLKPVIRVVASSGDTAERGAIVGVVMPSASVVMTMVGADTVRAEPYPESGAYRLAMLPVGTYTVTIMPLLNAYGDSVITGVGVEAGMETDLGLVALVPILTN
ncbi:DUF4382 domain-containing protein [bacterium]|nr:DUF4382 domain-containing protein [bacterium]